MGTADVIPGVSGGTMALILGIYQRLLEAIRAFDLRLLGLLVRAELDKAARHVDLLFVLPLVGGIFAALMFFTRVVSLPQLVRTQPEPVFALFFGLIAGSVIVLLRDLGGLRARHYCLLLAGALAGFGVVNIVPVETPETTWFVFITGMVAISALILPGISGSFVLLIMKKYAYIFDALGRLDFGIILPFALGAAVGLMGFSRLLTWLLRRCYRATLVTIVGVLIGSLWVIWPFQQRVYETVRAKPRLVSAEPFIPDNLSSQVSLAAALALLGFVGVLLLARYAHRAESMSGSQPSKG